MKRERNLWFEDNENASRGSERMIIDKENIQRHTIWRLNQAQKYLSKISKTHCYLCNTMTLGSNAKSADSDKIKAICDYCGRMTCCNKNCRLLECANCESQICNLCGCYNYGKSDSSREYLCPDCIN
ncbi:Cd27 binding protein (Siva) [Cryptosporidium felis]|nr:Cd27 binding protein (Siva) [Cryptosporidium felis]